MGSITLYGSVFQGETSIPTLGNRKEVEYNRSCVGFLKIKLNHCYIKKDNAWIGGTCDFWEDN